MIIAGADGCKKGWICLSRDLNTGRIHSEIYTSALGLFQQVPRPVLLALDIPIGLPDQGARACDKAARKVLGKGKGSTVFPAPIRPVLQAADHKDACRIWTAVEGKGMSVQGWGIVPKVRDVDQTLHAHPEFQEFVREVHPEVSFSAWAGAPIVESKKSHAGRVARQRLVADYFGADAYQDVRSRYLVKDVAHDDILDAFAALWTAEQAAGGDELTLPENPPRDRYGLRMEILYSGRGAGKS